MKILQIHNEYKFRGGEDIVVEDEKKLLIKNGHKVFQLKKKNLKEITNLYEKLKVAINLFYSKSSKDFVIKKIKKINPDIIHIHNTFPLWTFSVIDACNEANVPVVMTLHNYRIICSKAIFFRNNKICELCINSSPLNAIKFGCYQNSKLKSIPVSLMIKKYKKGLALVKKVNKFIVLTKFSKKKLLEINFPKNKIAIKPNFISKNFNKYITNKKGFLFASRLSEEKGLLDLIDAHNKYNFDLRVCGEGPLKNYLNNFQNIKYLGLLNREKLYYELGNSEFLIFPSKSNETFGNIIIEAFALETIVIAPKLDSISCIIKDKFNGILFEPNNTNDLVNKIKWAIKNKIICNQIVQNAKIDLKKKYTDKINYQILKKIYDDAIQENKNYQLPN